MGKSKSRNQNKRKGGNHNTSHNAQSQDGARDEQVEGIRIKGGARHNNQGRRNECGRGGDWNRSDSWSMSPEQSDPDSSRSQPDGRDKPRNVDSQLRTPPKRLADQMSHEDPERLEQARESQTPTPAAPAPAPAKRKRTREDEDEPPSGKKTRTHGEMQPAISDKKSEEDAREGGKQVKVAVKMSALKNMSPAEKIATRKPKFQQTIGNPKNAPIPPKDTPKDLRQSKPKDTKDDRKTTPIAKPATPLTDAPAANSSSALKKKAEDVMPEKQDDIRPKIAATGTRQKPDTKPATTAATELSSTSSNKSGTPPASRKRPNSSNAEDTAEPESKRQKSDSGDTEAPSTQTPSSETSAEDKGKGKKQSTPSPEELAQQKRNSQLLSLMNNLAEHEEENIEKELNFIDYGVFSIPLICSASIEHQYQYTPVFKLTADLKKKMTETAASVFEFTMIELRQKALYLSRQKYLTSEDLGRKKVRKSRPTRFIDDCDLYLYEGKVHVATEKGLVLAADYLQLIGVPDEQPVRFEGHEPAWMAPVKAMREHRRVLIGYEITTDEEKKHGNIDIISGSTVVIYEYGVELIDGKENVMAYGARVGDGVRGWFPYEHTCRLDWGPDTPPVRDPSVIDWTTFDYQPLVVLGAARQAQENAQQQAQVKALIQKDKADKIRERIQAQQQASAVAPQVAVILTQMSPIVMPEAPSKVSVSPTLVSAVIPRVEVPPAPISPTSASPKPSLHHPHQATSASAAHHITSRTTTVSSSSGSKHSTSTAASSQSSQSQGETVQMLSVAGGLIARHDSPQARSDKAISENNDDEVEKNDVGQDKTTVTEDGGIAEDEPVVAEEELTDASKKKLKSLPGLDGEADKAAKKAAQEAKKKAKEAKKKAAEEAKKKQGRYDEEYDWDTSDDDRAKKEEDQEPSEDEDDSSNDEQR